MNNLNDQQHADGQGGQNLLGKANQVGKNANAESSRRNLYLE